MSELYPRSQREAAAAVAMLAEIEVPVISAPHATKPGVVLRATRTGLKVEIPGQARIMPEVSTLKSTDRQGE